jgi:ATP-binding cassette subfamily A (ABC1) protein 3
MVRDLVAEKESKIKEGMKMMSLGNGALICSWIIHFGTTFWVIVLGITALSSQLFIFSDSGVVFLYFFLFMNSTMAFCYWVSSLFSRAKTAAIVGVMAYFMGYIATMGTENSTSWMMWALVCLHPTAAFTVGLNAFVEYEDVEIGVTFDTWSVTNQPHGFTFRDTCMMLMISIGFWGVLTWYCDNVIPSEWGTAQPPWFFLMPTYWYPSLHSSGGMLASPQVLTENEKQEKEEDAIEPVSEELLEQIANGNGIQIKNLRKSFETTAGVKHAVDGLNLNMYNNQITCLLGKKLQCLITALLPEPNPNSH